MAGKLKARRSTAWPLDASWGIYRWRHPIAAPGERPTRRDGRLVPALPMGVPLGRVVIAAGKPALTVNALMGEAAPTLSGGDSGWTEVERPGRLSLTSWKGRAPHRLAVDLMFDGWADGVSVEDECADLERMAAKVPGEPGSPLLKIGGAIPHPEYVWVLDGLAWGAALRGPYGQRRRQAVTATFLQYVDDDLTLDAGERAQGLHLPASARPIVVHKGENLREVAKRVGIPVKRLARANDVRDPRKNLKAGRHLRRP